MLGTVSRWRPGGRVVTELDAARLAILGDENGDLERKVVLGVLDLDVPVCLDAQLSDLPVVLLAFRDAVQVRICTGITFST